MRLYISKCLAQDLMKEKGFVRVFYCCITNCHKLRDFKQYTFVSQFASGDMAWLHLLLQGFIRLQSRAAVSQETQIRKDSFPRSFRLVAEFISLQL